MMQLSGTGVDAPATIIALSGSGQTTTYGSSFAVPLQVLNSSGVGVAKVPVTFMGNGVRLSSATVLTNASGFASVTASASQVGAVSATASIAGASTSVVFTETATKATLQVNPGVVYWDYNEPIVLSQFILVGVTNGDKSPEPRLSPHRRTRDRL